MRVDHHLQPVNAVDDHSLKFVIFLDQRVKRGDDVVVIFRQRKVVDLNLAQAVLGLHKNGVRKRRTQRRLPDASASVKHNSRCLQRAGLFNVR